MLATLFAIVCCRSRGSHNLSSNCQDATLSTIVPESVEETNSQINNVKPSSKDQVIFARCALKGSVL